MSSSKWPSTSVELRPIETLVPYVNNSRFAFRPSRSLLKFGWTNACLVAELIEEHGTESTVWEIPVSVDDGSTGHGTQKPVTCMARPIECNSKPGESVYEPFSGSGSTIIAGQMTARSVLAMELVPSYVDLAIRRWQNFTGALAHREDGVLFNDLEAGAPKESDDDAAWT